MHIAPGLPPADVWHCAGTQLSGAQPAKGRSAVVWLLEPAVASGSASSSPSAAGFRLHCMQQQTPEQRLLHLLTEQQWPAALSFAQEHGLSSDHVSRCVAMLPTSILQLRQGACQSRHQVHAPLSTSARHCS